MTPSTHEALVRAREALGPFAQAADAKEAEPWPGRSAHDDTKYSVAVGHLRAARSALALLDAALLHDPKAAPVSVMALAEEFIAQGAAMEDVSYDADTKQRMLAALNAGFNAGRHAAEATIAELRAKLAEAEGEREVFIDTIAKLRTELHWSPAASPSQGQPMKDSR